VKAPLRARARYNIGPATKTYELTGALLLSFILTYIVQRASPIGALRERPDSSRALRVTYTNLVISFTGTSLDYQWWSSVDMGHFLWAPEIWGRVAKGKKRRTAPCVYAQPDV